MKINKFHPCGIGPLYVHEEKAILFLFKLNQICIIITLSRLVLARMEWTTHVLILLTNGAVEPESLYELVRPVFVQRLFVQGVFIQSYKVRLGSVRLG